MAAPFHVAINHRPKRYSLLLEFGRKDLLVWHMFINTVHAHRVLFRSLVLIGAEPAALGNQLHQVLPIIVPESVLATLHLPNLVELGETDIRLPSRILI